MGDYTRAVYDYNEILAHDPENSTAYEKLANAHFSIAQYDQCIIEASKLLFFDYF